MPPCDSNGRKHKKWRAKSAPPFVHRFRSRGKLPVDGGVVFVRPGVAEVCADEVRDDAKDRHSEAGDCRADDAQDNQGDQALLHAAGVRKAEDKEPEDCADDRIFLLHDDNSS